LITQAQGNPGNASQGQGICFAYYCALRGAEAYLLRPPFDLLRLATAGKTLDRIQGRPECFSQAIAYGLHS